MRHHHHHHGHGRLHEALHSFIGRHRHGHHGFGGFEGFEDGEGRGRRGRRVFDAAELRLVLLKLLADQPRHGYDLIRAIEELTAGAYSPSPGVVYPTLTMLADMGHIAEEASEGSRKTYAVTSEGLAFLEARKREVEALIARLTDMGKERKTVDATSIRRAMGNLRTVLMNQLRLGEPVAVPAETVQAITAIIDEAAQRIERL
jgi:DNA-binding PadR family transcriptional regulator